MGMDSLALQLENALVATRDGTLDMDDVLQLSSTLKQVATELLQVELDKLLNEEQQIAARRQQLMSLVNDPLPGVVAKPTVQSKRRVVLPVYEDPANPNNTWSGRGKAPAWMKAFLDAGRDKEDFRMANRPPKRVQNK